MCSVLISISSGGDLSPSHFRNQWVVYLMISNVYIFLSSIHVACILKLSSNMAISLYRYSYVPVLGPYGAECSSIGPFSSQFWHIYSHVCRSYFCVWDCHKPGYNGGSYHLKHVFTPPYSWENAELCDRRA